VRQAIGHALDGAFIARSVMPGGEANHGAEALCTREQLGCDYSTRPPAYDVSAAKALLAEAGYKDGFDVTIVAMPGSWEIAGAISGELRKIGIRASVEKATQGTMRERQAQGKLALFAGFWPPVYHLDASALVAYLFDDTPRNYWRDPLMKELGDRGVTTVDPAARKAIYRQLFDRVNAMAYVVPLAVTPQVIVHAKDLYVEGKPRHPIGPMFYDLHWN
jgi:peptide/nickel transport system substrate-binding protein